MNKRGTITIARAVFDHPVFKAGPFNEVCAWVWMIAEATWSSRRVTVSAVTLELKRGELAASTRHLAETWGWDHSKLRRFLERIERKGMIKRRIATGSCGSITVFSIVNFEYWQGAKNRHTSDTPPNTSTDTTCDTPLNVENDCSAAISEPPNVVTDTPLNTARDTGGERQPTQIQTQHIQKEKIICPLKPLQRVPAGPAPWPPGGFDVWYPKYPKKVDRKDAQRAFLKLAAAPDIEFDRLLAVTDVFCRRTHEAWAKGEDRKFCKAPAVWLNKGSYLNDDLAPSASEQRDPMTFTTEEWKARLEVYGRSGKWPTHWGATPGSANCYVPSELLRAGPEGASFRAE